MTFKNIISVSFISLFLLTFYNCKKEETAKTNELPTTIEETISTEEEVPFEENNEFCSLINQNYFDSTKIIVNTYLSTQTVGTSDEKLNNLADWFKNYSCVDNAEVLCNSCIFVGPGVSELRVNFIKNEQIDSMICDIVMYDTLKFTGFH